MQTLWDPFSVTPTHCDSGARSQRGNALNGFSLFSSAGLLPNREECTSLSAPGSRSNQARPSQGIERTHGELTRSHSAADESSTPPNDRQCQQGPVWKVECQGENIAAECRRGGSEVNFKAKK